MDSKFVHEKAFKTKLNGYSCMEVDDFMDEVAAVIDALNEKLAESKAKAEALAAEVEQYKTMENALRDSMILAQRTSSTIAEEARAKAHATTTTASFQAAKTVDEANAKAASIVFEATEKSKAIYEGEKKLREVIETYKRQIREVMNVQLSAMEEIFVLNDTAANVDIDADVDTEIAG